MSQEFTEENVNKAKKLLKEAGYDDLSEFPTIVILVRSRKFRNILKNHGKNLGINVEVDVCKDVLFSQRRIIKNLIL